MTDYSCNPYADIFVCANATGEDESDVAEKLKQQQKEAARRENTLVHRLATKEQELQDYVVSDTYIACS